MKLARASGVGSWPDVGAHEATKIVAELLANSGSEGGTGIPYLPELPMRGPGADMIGRAGAFLDEMSIDLQPSGWRLSSGRSRDVRRGESYLAQDVDQIAELYAGYSGPLKTQVCGPLTLAASLWLPRGERVLSDSGAMRDVTQSLAAGVSRHIADLRRLVPGADVILQLDEPGISAVLRGELRTASGLGRLRALEDSAARELVNEVLETAGSSGAETVVHTCAPTAPIELLRKCGAHGISLDTSLLTHEQYDALGAFIDDGGTLWAGIVPTSGPLARHPQGMVETFTQMWNRIGFGTGEYGQLVITPACGLASSTPREAIARQRLAIDAASMMNDAAA